MIAAPNLPVSPAQVPGLSEVIAIAGGEGYAVALKEGKTVWTWGSNPVWKPIRSGIDLKIRAQGSSAPSVTLTADSLDNLTPSASEPDGNSLED
jgi:hypothetical protein